MRLKSFYAKTMTEAMQMVRDTLGEDAVIVATREERGGKAVRVTAAVEQEDRYSHDYGQESATRNRSKGSDMRGNDMFADELTRTPHFELDTVDAPATEARDWLQYDDEDEENAVIEQLTDVMLRHSVADEITDQIISCATVMGLDDAESSLVAALEHLYSFRPLPKKATQVAQMVVGPPGSGKTLAIAKMAARAVMGGMRVAVISTDTVRAGGIEQLSAFTKLLRIDLQKASSPKDLRAAIEASRGADQILIDTSGINPFDVNEMRDLARLISAGDIDPILVLPAGIDSDESGEIARAYATLGVRAILPTRLDIARRLGGLLGAAHHGGLIFADASDTARVADGLVPLSPTRLAQLLMPRARKQNRSHTSKNARAG